MEIDKILNEETKFCPECAETIKLKAKKCRYCQAQLNPEEVDRQVEARRTELLSKKKRELRDKRKKEILAKKYEEFLAKEREELLAKGREGKTQCPQCGNWDVKKLYLQDFSYGDYCPHCKQSLKSMGFTYKEQNDFPITYEVFGYEFKFLSSSFNWLGKEYPYKSVKKLGFYRRKSSLYFIPVGDYVRVKIFIENLKNPITIDDKNGFAGETKGVLNMYTKLGEMTFLFRLERYINELEEYGYFSYDKAKFYLDGKVTYGSLSFDVFDSKMWTQPFTLFMAKRSKIGLVVNPKKISTEINRDVLFYLLEKLYGITF